MGAPKNNRFWKLRAKHGRDKVFETPQSLLETAYQFFEDCEQNPLHEEKVFGTGKRMKVSHQRAFTLAGLCVYAGVNTRYFNDFKEGLKGKTDEQSKGFSDVIHYIQDIMFSQKFSGAAVGLFNANIISRDLGLIDKKDNGDGEPLQNRFDALMIKLKNKENDQ